jgi:hypothetical protein
MHSSKHNKKFREELIAYFLLIGYEPHRKRRLQNFFGAAGKFYPSFYLVTIEGYTERPTDSPLIRRGPYRKRRAQQYFYGCRGNVFSEQVPTFNRAVVLQR